MVKLKEEFDYKSLCRRMEAELDRLVAENERQEKARRENDEELERTVEDSRQLVMAAESRLQTALDVRRSFLSQVIRSFFLRGESGSRLFQPAFPGHLVLMMVILGLRSRLVYII